jgi:hypothetical protein
MKSKYVIRVVRPDTGAHLFSHTNNLKKRLEMLKYNIESINGRGTAVFERFVPFIGVSADQVAYEVYKEVDKQPLLIV